MWIPYHQRLGKGWLERLSMDLKTLFTKTAKAALTMPAKGDSITPVVQVAQTHAKGPPVPPSQSPVVTDSNDGLGFTSLLGRPIRSKTPPLR
jgi:hypothetical protein